MGVTNIWPLFDNFCVFVFSVGLLLIVNFEKGFNQRKEFAQKCDKLIYEMF